MGYDYFTNTCDTIDPAVIEKVAPAEWITFQQTVSQVATSTNRTADDLLAAIGREEDRGDSQYDDDEDVCNMIITTVTPALDTLRVAFTAATGGIGLHLGYADSDTFRGSDLNDEIYWYISSHQQPTPAYQAFIASYGEAITTTCISGG